MRLSRVIDTALDRTVAPGFSRVGYAVRKRLPGWPDDPEPGSLDGRSAIVTGASSGLGIATVAGLARLGARVHLVVRDEAKGKGVLSELRRAVPGAVLTLWRCDVSDLEDVRRFAKDFSVPRPPSTLVVHNAGALPPARPESAQGHEMTMALHLLGPLLMTEPARRSCADRDARVILVTSGGMYTQRLRDDDPEFRSGDYSGTVAYARSKRAQVELLPPLTERWAPYGVRVYATHPGWADTPGVAESLPAFRKLTGPILRDADEGADTTVWLAATSPAPHVGRAVARPAPAAHPHAVAHPVHPRPGRPDVGVGRGAGPSGAHPVSEPGNESAGLSGPEQGVRIYWRPGCPYCLVLRARVRKYSPRATWVNIWEDPDGAAYVRSVNGGNETVPTVVIDGVPHTNPSPGVVRAALAALT